LEWLQFLVVDLDPSAVPNFVIPVLRSLSEFLKVSEVPELNGQVKFLQHAVLRKLELCRQL
jgi:hypothetical protein